MRLAVLAIFAVVYTPFLIAQSGTVRNAATGNGTTGQTLEVVLVGTAVPSSAPPVLAPNSRAIITSFGTGAQPSAITATVSLRPEGSQTVIPAQVLAADPFTITFVVPPTAPTGAAQLIYKTSGNASQWIEVAIAPSSFALFTNNATGAPVAQFVQPGNPAKPLALATPVRPGQDAVIWGSGLGLPPANIRITLGGVRQEILFVGGPLESTGVDQINFAVAPNTPAGCYVPLVVTSSDNNSTSSFLSVSSDGSACHHPFNLTANELANIDEGGILNVGTVDFSSDTTVASTDHASRAESVSAVFEWWNGNFLSNRLMSPSSAGCSPTAYLPNPSFVAAGSFAPITLSKGPSQIDLTEAGATQSFPAGDAPLATLPASMLGPGQWSLYLHLPPVSPPSSFAAVGLDANSQPNLTFPINEPVALAGASTPVPLSRSSDQTVLWNGSDLDPQAQTILTLKDAKGQGVTCFAGASSGSMTIPKDQLNNLATGAATLRIAVSQALTDAPNLRFRGSNGGSGVLVISQTSSDTRPVVLQ